MKLSRTDTAKEPVQKPEFMNIEEWLLTRSIDLLLSIRKWFMALVVVGVMLLTISFGLAWQVQSRNHTIENVKQTSRDTASTIRDLKAEAVRLENRTSLDPRVAAALAKIDKLCKQTNCDGSNK